MRPLDFELPPSNVICALRFALESISKSEGLKWQQCPENENYCYIINALNYVQKGWSFTCTERKLKKVVTRTFNILTTVTNWVKSVLEVMLNSCSQRCHKSGLNLISNYTPFGLLQRKTQIFWKTYKFWNFDFRNYKCPNPIYPIPSQSKQYSKCGYINFISILNCRRVWCG